MENMSGSRHVDTIYLRLSTEIAF